jgi:hypothetical protein
MMTGARSTTRTQEGVPLSSGTAPGPHEDPDRVTKLGAITAMDFESSDGGAYGSYGVASAYCTAPAGRHYEIPSAGSKALGRSPAGPAVPSRSRHSAAAFAWRFSSKIAEELKLDPRGDAAQTPVKPNTITRTGPGQYDGLVSSRESRAGSRWKERYGKLPYGRGIGLACSSYITGAGVASTGTRCPIQGSDQMRSRRRGDGLLRVTGSVRAQIPSSLMSRKSWA